MSTSQTAPPAPIKSAPMFKALQFGNRLNEPLNPSYAAEKKKLDQFRTFLTTTLKTIDETMAAWVSVAKLQNKFALLVHQSAAMAPASSQSKFRRPVKTTFACSNAIYDEGFKDTVVPNALHQLRRLLVHITSVQDRFRDISKAKTQYESALQKYRTLDARPNAGKESLQKSKFRYERLRDLYEAMVARVEERMTEANSRRPDAHRTIHYLFWIMQERASGRIVKATEIETSAASAAEPALCYVTVCHGLKPADSMFDALIIRKGDST